MTKGVLLYEIDARQFVAGDMQLMPLTVGEPCVGATVM
jgi:hypothetical protein